MVSYIKTADPDESSRRLNVIMRRENTLLGLNAVPFRQEALLIDFILAQWFTNAAGGLTISEARKKGTLARRINTTLKLARQDGSISTSSTSQTGSEGDDHDSGLLDDCALISHNKPGDETIAQQSDVSPVNIAYAKPATEPESMRPLPTEIETKSPTNADAAKSAARAKLRDLF